MEESYRYYLVNLFLIVDCIARFFFQSYHVPSAKTIKVTVPNAPNNDVELSFLTCNGTKFISWKYPALRLVH